MVLILDPGLEAANLCGVHCNVLYVTSQVISWPLIIAQVLANEINARKKAKKAADEDYNKGFHSKHLGLLAFGFYKS